LGTLFPRIKWLLHEAAHSPLCSAGVENAWSYTFTFSCVFMICTRRTLSFYKKYELKEYHQTFPAFCMYWFWEEAGNFNFC
jgi:hypothetical protein